MRKSTEIRRELDDIQEEYRKLKGQELYYLEDLIEGRIKELEKELSEMKLERVLIKDEFTFKVKYQCDFIAAENDEIDLYLVLRDESIINDLRDTIIDLFYDKTRGVDVNDNPFIDVEVSME